MRSTFMGLETAKRGMYAQQSAIYVTGHNIANKNTPGYTRQRVNFEQSEPYPVASMNRPQIPGQLGTGVKDGAIQRIRESFIDEQYRGENNKSGYYETLASSLRKMEEIMNEPSDFGLSKAMAQFWQSLQDLSTNPENEGARRVVLQRGISVAETFQYLHSSLTTLRNDIQKEVDATVTEINSIAKQISAINKQISEVEPHGYLPNDLYDERDRLLDQLSKLVPIETKIVPNGGNSSAIAEGGRSVTILTEDGPRMLVDEQNADIPLQVNELLKLGEGKGRLSALLYAYGDGETGTGLYPEMLADLDKYAFTYAQVFNEIHQQGYDLNDQLGKDFFTFGEPALPDYHGAAGKMLVAIKNPAEIAAAAHTGENGNGSNALKLGALKDAVILEGNMVGIPFELEIKSGTLQSFYEGVIGEMAVKGQQANRLEHNTNVLLQSVDQQRRSVSEVSLDEEFSNLIQYQHAYSASARMVNVIDEMLDKIINGMGIVGR